MRRKYIKPMLCMVEYTPAKLMSTSGVHAENGPDYGGVDKEGEREMDSRGRRSAWDDFNE